MAIHPWGDHDADANHETAYERGVADERKAIEQHIAAKLDHIIRTVGYRCFENTCRELEALLDDIKNERHL